MNWEAASAIGEMIGAAAVVVSLVYLASQIRTQNREARAASVHQVMHEYAEAISRLHEPEMAEIWVRAHEDFDSLSAPPNKALQRIINGSVQLTLLATWRHTSGAGSVPVSAVVRCGMPIR